MYEALTILVLMVLFAFREIQHTRDHIHWYNERKDLYNRIQAGSLQEYKQSIQEPSGSVVKSRDQLAAEEAEEKGIPVSDLRYPQIWSSGKR